jgi:NAD-dependent dihydropyrimidine dehydrogenase PreA subunit
VAKCPMNVFDIEDSGTSLSSTSLHQAAHSHCPCAFWCCPAGKAYVKNQRNCTMCRECIREDGWDKRIKLLRVKDHFICTFSSALSLQPYMARLTNPCFPPVPHTISLDRIDGNPSAQRALRGGRKGLHGQVPHRPHRTRQPPRPVKDPLRHSNHKNNTNYLQIIFPPFSFFPILKSDKNRTAILGPFR